MGILRPITGVLLAVLLTATACGAHEQWTKAVGER